MTSLWGKSKSAVNYGYGTMFHDKYKMPGLIGYPNPFSIKPPSHRIKGGKALIKGSKEAKQRMAYLRSLRGKKKGGATSGGANFGRSYNKAALLGGSYNDAALLGGSYNDAALLGGKWTPPPQPVWTDPSAPALPTPAPAPAPSLDTSKGSWFYSFMQKIRASKWLSAIFRRLLGFFGLEIENDQALADYFADPETAQATAAAILTGVALWAVSLLIRKVVDKIYSKQSNKTKKEKINQDVENIENTIETVVENSESKEPLFLDNNDKNNNNNSGISESYYIPDSGLPQSYAYGRIRGKCKKR